MVKSRFEIIMWRIVAFAVIFTQLFGYSIVFADATYNEADLRGAVEKWLKGNGEINLYKDEEKGNIYALEMPKIPKNSGIYYDASTQGYVYYIKNGDDFVGKIPIKIEVLCAPGGTVIDEENYTSYVDAGPSQFFETEDSQLRILKSVSGEKVSFTYAVSINGGTPFVVPEGILWAKPNPVGKSIWEWLGEAAQALWDSITAPVKNALATIVNGVLLGIADGIHFLVDEAMGEEGLTVYKVIFNKIDKLDIDFWGIDSGSSIFGNSNNNSDLPENPDPEGILPADDDPDDKALVKNPVRNVLKNIVSYWYNVLSGIGIAIYLVMLLYIGVRILLASTTSSAQKYKEMLTSWLVGVIILTLFPYAMKGIVIVNETFIEILDESAETKLEENQTQTDPPPENLNDKASDDAMDLIREQAEKDTNIALSIVYIIMIGQLIVLLGVYYKRVFMMAFLITIFPVVATLYVWEKANKGAAGALKTWTKEYTVLIFTQTFHAMTYVILVKSAYEAFLKEGNWFIFILSVIFLFEGERILRSIFGMKSSVNTIGDLAATGAAAWAATRGIGKMFKLDKEKKSEDAADEKDARQEVEEAQRSTAVNNALRNRFNNQHSASDNQQGNLSNNNASNNSQSNVANNTNANSNSNSTNTQPQPEENQLNNLDAARALIRQKALEELNRKKGKGILQKGINIASRATGITLGMASGMAAGSVKDGMSNAVIANEITGTFGKWAGGIVGYAQGIYRGQRMKMKIRSGAMDQELRNVGFDFGGSFDSDPDISSAKARIIREALAAEIAGVRSGGKVKGELKFVKAVEKGIKKENLH